MADNENIRIIELKFEDVKPPVTREDKGKGFIRYGKDNAYPNYLLEMFEKSSKHGAIVRGKADFIKGKGFAYKEIDEANTTKAKNFIEKCNEDGESLNEVLGKVALDIEIFAGGYLEIIYNNKKKVSEIYHLPFDCVRPNKDLSKFFYAEDWTTDVDGKIIENRKPTIIDLPAFDKNKPGGKQVLFIREYSPGKKVYPTPNYFASLRYIQVDINISEYHLNGTNNGMFSSKMINFNNGVPELEDQKKIEKQVNDKFAGTKNAGRIMLSFSNNGDNAPTVLDLSGTELDKHFDLLNKTIQQEIFSGHRVTSGMIFGVKTEGQLGGRTELREAFELFDNTYVNTKREVLERHFNNVLSINGIQGLYLQKSEPIGYDISQTAIDNALSDDEKRERLGLKPRKQEQAAAPVQAAKPTGFNSDDLDDEADILVFERFGKKKIDFEILHSSKVMFDSDFAFMRGHYAAVADLTDVQISILDLVNKDNRVTAEAIAKALSVSVQSVNAILKDLQVSNYIKVTTEVTDSGEEVKVRTPTASGNDIIGKKPEKTEVSIMYSYEGPIDDRNRPFCAKLVTMDKVFTREEIEEISLRLGYSVWHRRGGWYRQADGTSRPYCRHSWVSNTVIKKS